MSDDLKPYVSKIDRRTALTWIGVVGAAMTVGGGVVACGPKTGGKPQATGYGTDPNLVNPAKAPWPRLLSHDELQTAAVLADFILPATATAPSASSLGIPDFIDEWVSAPYPEQLKHRPVIQAGLKAVGGQIAGDAAKRKAALEALRTSTDAQTQGFFKLFRGLTIGAYYTTEEGFKDVGYVGNVARQADEGPSAEVKAVLQTRLKALGL